MKYQHLLLVIVVVALSTLACGSSDSGAEVNLPTNAASTGGGETTSQPEPSGSELGLARDNPAPLGSEVVLGDAAVKVANVTRPANDIVAAGNQFNTPPESGQEYLMIEVSITCKASDSCDVSPLSFSAVGANGIAYDAEMFVTGVDGLLETGEFFSGATKTGKLFFLVQQGETGMVLIYQPNMFIEDERVFLSLE